MATYTVKSGDTLSAIASRYGVDWRKITGFRSGDPNKIYVGETLQIPDKGQILAASTTAPAPQQTTTVQKAVSTLTPNFSPTPTNTQSAQLKPTTGSTTATATSSSPITMIKDGYVYTKQYNTKTNSYEYIRFRQAGTNEIAQGKVLPEAQRGSVASNYPNVTVASAGGGGQQYPNPANQPPANKPTQTFGDLNKKYGNQDIATIIDKGIKDVSMSESEKAALEALKASNLDYNTFEQTALSELTPYYEKLLREANYDIDLALRHLEEGYQLGIRQSRAKAGEGLKDLYPTFKQETQSALASLNKRGLLGTIEGPTETISATTPDTGEKLGGERIMGFGGLAGSQLDILRKSQQARSEAIQRALARQEESEALRKKQEQELAERKRQTTAMELETRKKEQIPQLAQSKYQRALTELELKRNAILGTG